MKYFILILLVFVGYIDVRGENMLPLGTKAPDFTILSHNGKNVTLSSFRGKSYVVLIFYPGDQTPVCTQQLCEIRDNYSQFKDRDAVVFGVNPGDQKSHQNFVEKNSYQFELLIDEKGRVAKKYKSKGFFMNKRSVYVINKEGVIIFAKRGKPSVQKILKSIPKP